MAGAHGCRISTAEAPWSCARREPVPGASQRRMRRARRLSMGPLPAIAVAAKRTVNTGPRGRWFFRPALGARGKMRLCSPGAGRALLQGPALAARDRLAFLAQVAPEGAGILEADGVGGIIIEFDQHQALVSGVADLAGLGHLREPGG